MTLNMHDLRTLRHTLHFQTQVFVVMMCPQITHVHRFGETRDGIPIICGGEMCFMISMCPGHLDSWFQRARAGSVDA